MHANLIDFNPPLYGNRFNILNSVIFPQCVEVFIHFQKNFSETNIKQQIFAMETQY